MKELKKEFTNIYFLFGVLILMLMLISIQLLFSTDNIIKKIEQPTPTDLTYLTDFELIELAIIWQESKGNPEAVNENSKGIFQITPIYVKEANRILKEDRYTPEDCRNAQKSHEMFEVVQSYHNPEKDVKKAIKLHNPTAASWYYESVMNYYNFLKYVNETCR